MHHNHKRPLDSAPYQGGGEYAGPGVDGKRSRPDQRAERDAGIYGEFLCKFVLGWLADGSFHMIQNRQLWDTYQKPPLCVPGMFPTVSSGCLSRSRTVFLFSKSILEDVRVCVSRACSLSPDHPSTGTAQPVLARIFLVLLASMGDRLILSFFFFNPTDPSFGFLRVPLFGSSISTLTISHNQIPRRNTGGNLARQSFGTSAFSALRHCFALRRTALLSIVSRASRPCNATLSFAIDGTAVS